MSTVLRTTLLSSLLLHALLYWLFMADFAALFNHPTEPDEYTLEFQLSPTLQKPIEKKEVLKQDDLPPPPKHLENDINKANLSDGIAETGTKQKQAKQPKAQASSPEDIPKPDQPFNPNLLSSFLAQQKIAKQQSAQAKAMETKTMSSLDDSALDDSLVESPKSEAEEEKARWFNEVLKRISEQVNYVWVKPQGIGKHVWGEITMELDRNGYLVKAWVRLPSGNVQLDRSALRAIQSVGRFEIPHSDKLNRYYRNLKFRYTG